MLKLSTRGRYGLRALIEIAHHYKEGPVLMGDIAKRQQFSRKYLHALLTSLKEAGLVRSQRGARGGYLLAMDPSDILMSDVFEALEGMLSIIDCLTDPARCERQQNCDTWPLWKRLNDNLQTILEGTTLADMMRESKASADFVESSEDSVCMHQKIPEPNKKGSS